MAVVCGALASDIEQRGELDILDLPVAECEPFVVGPAGLAGDQRVERHCIRALVGGSDVSRIAVRVFRSNVTVIEVYSETRNGRWPGQNYRLVPNLGVRSGEEDEPSAYSSNTLAIK